MLNGSNSACRLTIGVKPDLLVKMALPAACLLSRAITNVWQCGWGSLLGGEPPLCLRAIRTYCN
jgi:hypothetical protein